MKKREDLESRERRVQRQHRERAVRQMQEEGQKVESDARGGSGKEKGKRGRAKGEEGAMEKGQRVVGAWSV